MQYSGASCAVLVIYCRRTIFLHHLCHGTVRRNCLVPVETGYASPCSKVRPSPSRRGLCFHPADGNSDARSPSDPQHSLECGHKQYYSLCFECPTSLHALRKSLHAATDTQEKEWGSGREGESDEIAEEGDFGEETEGNIQVIEFPNSCSNIKPSLNTNTS